MGGCVCLFVYLLCFYHMVFKCREADSLLLQYHKRHERDLLDQKKEKEETLLLEMVRDPSCRRISAFRKGFGLEAQCTIIET